MHQPQPTNGTFSLPNSPPHPVYLQNPPLTQYDLMSSIASQQFSSANTISTSNSGIQSLSTSPEYFGKNNPSFGNVNEYFTRYHASSSSSLSSLGKNLSNSNLQSHQRMSLLKSALSSGHLTKNTSLSSLNLEFYHQNHQFQHKRSRPNSPTPSQGHLLLGSNLSIRKPQPSHFIISPSETPLQTPSETPVQTPTQTPSQTPSQSPNLPAQPYKANQSHSELLDAATKKLQKENHSIATTGTSLPPIRKVFSFTNLTKFPTPVIPSVSATTTTIAADKKLVMNLDSLLG
jgi:zinc finger protein CreA/MIG